MRGFGGIVVVMRTVVTIAAVLVWGLWFGGLVTLFISVQSLFGGDRAVAMQAAPMLFAAFETYQFFLAAAAVLVFAALAAVRRETFSLVVGVLTVLTAGLALVSGLLITPALEDLRLEGLGGGEDFRWLHAWSMRVYTAQTVLLLMAGILLAVGLNRENAGRYNG